MAQAPFATLENRLRSLWNRPDTLRRWLTGIIFLLGLLAGSGIRGTLTLDWQHIYRPEDFESWSQIWDYLANLQTGIPVLTSMLELVFYKVFGTVAPLEYGLYPLCLAGTAVFPLRLFTKTSWQITLTAAFVVIFLACTRILHQGNPQLYDLYLPLLFLSFLATLQKIRAQVGLPIAGKRLLWLCLQAGLLFSLLELTRSFVFVLAPLLLLLTVPTWRQLPRRYALYFLLPILLLSGGWHSKQWLSHRQVHWTNHSAFNLYNNWKDLVGPIDYEEAPPLFPGGFNDINTELHSQNNRDLRSRIRNAMMANPGKVFSHWSLQTWKFFTPKLELYSARLYSPFPWFYCPMVWFCGLALLGGCLLVAWQFLRAPLQRKTYRFLGEPATIASLGTATMVLVFTFGEAGEEARFLISLLPMLISVPSLRLFPRIV